MLPLVKGMVTGGLAVYAFMILMTLDRHSSIQIFTHVCLWLGVMCFRVVPERYD
jgi:hypothetical protein